MGTICTWEPYVHGNHLYIGTICTWEPFVHRNHLYLGTICTWEPFVHGNHLYIGTMETKFIQECYWQERFFRNVLGQELYCQEPFFEELYFQEHFAGNVLVGTFWQGRSVPFQCRFSNFSVPFQVAFITMKIAITRSHSVIWVLEIIP
jgi:hypothetical protein